MASDLVFVGTYSEPILFGTGQVLHGKGKGIYAFRFDRATGALNPCGLTPGVRNSSYLAFDPMRRFLYCVNEFKEFEGKSSGAVSAFRIDRETGDLAYLNTKASEGTDPCHLIVDATGRNVLVANFASGSICVLPVRKDGSLGDASQVIQHEGSSVDPVRQKGPHAHAVAIDCGNRYAFVPDLGLDKVMIYAFDPASGELTPNVSQPWVSTAPGAGPRQLVMHPGGGFAYLINELNSTMTAYGYDAARGALRELHTLPTLPAGFAGRSTCAEVQIAPSGRFLYGSNRGHDSLAIFAIDDATGTLAPVGWEPTQGKSPRFFAIDPSGALLHVANMDSDSIVVFRVDQATGTLSATGQVVKTGSPSSIVFV